MKKITLILFFIAFCNPLFASEITVFLLKGHNIKDKEIVASQGHTIRFIYMDDGQRVTEEIEKRFLNQYQDVLDSIAKEVGEDKLTAMEDVARTELFISMAKDRGVIIDNRHITPEEMSRIQVAAEDQGYANEQGVTPEMLPALIFKGNLYRNVTNYSFLFKQRVQ